MGKGIVKLGEGQWAVKDGNLLAAKETNGRFKNTEFTVSRGTRASYVGRDGLIKESNLQDVNLVNNGDFSELGSELVTNGDFGNGTIGWSSGNSTLSVVDGKLKVLAINAFSYARQDITVASGKTYKITANFFYNSLVGNIEAYDGTTNTISEQLSEDGVITLYVTPSSTNLRLTLLNRNGSSGDFNYWDNVSIKEVDPNDYWTAQNGWTLQDGLVSFGGTVSSYRKLFQENFLTIGNTYKLSFEILSISSGSIANLEASSPSFDTVGVKTQTFVATYDDLYLEPTNDANLTITNISIQEVKTDTPRIDFTDNTDGHLLLEPQSTNLLPYSEDFSQWLPTNVNTTQNAVTSPDGTVNADKLIGTSTTIQHRINFTSSNASGSTTFSFFAKSAEYNSCWARIGLDGAYFDLENGLTGGQSSGITSSIVNYGNGWYRCIITKASSSVNEVCRINLTASYLGVGDFLGDDTSGIYIYGGQHEQLSHPTSYIPTNGSTVTRDAETCTGAGSSADFNSEEGVLYAEIAALAEVNQGIAISNGTYDSRILFYFDTDGNIRGYIFASGNQFAQNTSGINYKSLTKMAIKYSATSTKFFVNGNLIGTEDTSSTMPSGLNQLSLHDGGGGNKFYGKVKALRVYKEALSDTDLQNLTS